MRGRLVLLIALIGLAVSAASAAQPPAATGLRGSVFSQIRPICFDDRSCLAPVGDVVLVFRRDGRVVARATSQAGGTYRVRLATGRYSVSVANRPTARITPESVRVVAGLVRRVDFELDSGLQ